MKIIKKIKKMLCLVIKKYRKTDKYFWVFSSYIGKYDDSPKLLSEYIHEHYPKIKIYWLLSKENYNKVPNYVNKLDYNNCADKEFALSNASVLIDNIYGINSKFLFEDEKNKNYFFRFHSFLEKRTYQNYYSFWHGMGMKTSIGEREDLKIKNISLGNMYFLLGSQQTIEKIKKRTLNRANDYVLTGCPRNDPLLSNSIDKKALKTKLGLPVDKKVVLFAPTFRGNTKNGFFDYNISGIEQLKMINTNELLSALSSKFGGEFIFVVRFHHLVEKRLNLNDIRNNSCVFSGNVSPNMVDYLCIADVLISDYSSASFDFILTKNPVFLFVPDYNDYTCKYSLVRKIESLPFPFAYNFSELMKIIVSFDMSDYQSRIADFINKEGYLITDKSLEIAANYILKKEKIIK